MLIGMKMTDRSLRPGQLLEGNYGALKSADQDRAKMLLWLKKRVECVNASSLPRLFALSAEGTLP